MAQIPKIVDLTKGYVFTDPKAFADNRGHTQQQDAPVEILPVVAMEGYNFMPTAYGYRSYFGTNSTLDIAALGARVDFLIMMQMSNFKNVAIALCEDGIWWAQPTISGAVWAQAASYPIPTAGTHKDWTYALLENTLYCYLQGSPEVWKLSYMDFVDAPFSITFSKEVPSTFINYATLAAMNADTTITSDKVGKLCYNYETSLYYHLDSIAPTWTVYSSTTHGNFILNMAGQLGIFRANLRLAFWDSTNSIGWSDLYDKMDFEPSLETRAGNTIFSGILGRIVSILPQDTGFVIYSTKNIIGVRFANDVAQIWDASVVHDSAGIAYPMQVTVGASDSDQFAYTNIGFLAIGKFNPLTHKNEMSVIMPDVYDILKESGEPVRLDFLQGRYLFISLVDPTYITGAIRVTFDEVSSLTVRVLYNDPSNLDLYIPPTYIGEQSFTVNLASQIGSGITGGAYYRWAAKCYKIGLDRATHFNPISRDSFGGLVPVASVDATPSISEAEAKAIVRGELTYKTPSLEVAFEENNARIVLPWDMTTQGVSDAYLNLLTARQKSEWDLLGMIGLADKNRLEMAVSSAFTAIPLVVNSPTLFQTELMILERFFPVNVPQPAFHVIPYVAGITYTNVPLNSLAWVTGTALKNVLAGIAPAGAIIEADDTTGRGVIIQDPIKITIPTAVTSVPNIIAPGTSATLIQETPTIENTELSVGPATRYLVERGDPITSMSYGQLIPKTNDTTLGQAGWPVFYRLGPNWVQSVDPWHTTLVYGGTAIVRFNFTTMYPELEPDTPRTWSYTIIDPTLPDPNRTLVAIIGMSEDVNFLYFTVDTVAESTGVHFQEGWPLLRTQVRDFYPLGKDWYSTVKVSVESHGAASSQPPISYAEDSPMSATQMALDWATGDSPASYTYTDHAIVIPGVDLRSYINLPPYATVTYPGATFLMQDGSIAPIYPTFSGALVLDTHLKKLGKLKANYKALIEYAPINSNTYSLSFTNFGVSAGIVDAAGVLTVFDALPVDSYIKYGLYGLYRLGYTDLHEVKVTQRRPLEYTVVAAASTDGKSEDLFNKNTESYTASDISVLMADISGRWHTVKISGNYDLTGLEIRGTISGRR